MFSKLFSLKHIQFIFDLFLENKISAFYAPEITNNLNLKTFTPQKNTNNIAFKKLFIVKDIPSYLNIKILKTNPSFNHKKITQYKGYLVNLNSYNSAMSYIENTISKRNIKNLFSKKSKLQKNHKITYKVFFGTINKSEYDTVFKAFYDLLKTRFDEKKVYNRYLSNWEYLYKLSYQKILNKEASLHVIFDDEKPITITLNFHLGDIVFSHIQTYNINYSKYNMGDISMLNHLEWCIANNVSIFDLSMGKTEYKAKWCNYEYDFIYHIYYNGKSFISKIYSNIIMLELKCIQFLRDKNIAGKLIDFDKIMYKQKTIK